MKNLITYKNIPKIIYLSGIGLNLFLGGYVSIKDIIQEYKKENINLINGCGYITLGLSIGITTGITWPLYLIIAYKDNKLSLDENGYMYENYNYIKNTKGTSTYKYNINEQMNTRE